MIRYLIFIGLLTLVYSALGQTNACKIKIVRLKFNNNREAKSGEITDSALALAKPTNSILVNNADIKKFDIKTDTACCTYAGQMFITSHRYLLTSETVYRLAKLNIPLCCGIPIAIFVDDKEIYRAMLWNTVSSFGNKSLTMTLLNDTLIVNNRLPNVPDFGSSMLTSKKQSVNCLLDR